MDKIIFRPINLLTPVVQFFSAWGTAAQTPRRFDPSAKKSAEHRCSAGSFFVTIETFLTLSQERPVLPEQAREPGPQPEPEPPSQPVSALRLSCILRLQRITPRQKAGK